MKLLKLSVVTLLFACFASIPASAQYPPPSLPPDVPWYCYFTPWTQECIPYFSRTAKKPIVKKGLMKAVPQKVKSN